MDYITIGKVANAHGIKGDLKIFPTTDDITRFELLDRVYLESDQRVELTITNIKYIKNLVILSSKEITTMNQALQYKQADVVIPITEALPLAENENYIFQLIGLQGMDSKGQTIGELREVIQTGAHDVYVFDNQTKHGLMVPATKEFIKQVDLEKGCIVVELIEGLGDL